jgi:signal transduction histidine kinase
MTRIIFLLIFLLAQINIYGQRFNSLDNDGKFIDSITTIINTTQDDSVRAYLSFKISDLLRINGDMKKFEHFLKIGNKYSGKYEYLRDVSGYYNSVYHIRKGETDLFGDKISITLQKIKKHKFKASYEMQAHILQNLSIIRQMQDDEKESMRLVVEEAIPVAIKSKNAEIVSGLYKQVGVALMNIEDRKKADLYFQKSIKEISKASKKSPVLLESKVELFIFTAENLIYLEKLINGKEYLEKAFHILKDYPNSNLNGLYYYAEGLYYYKLKNYNQALISYEKGLKNCILNNEKQSLNRLKFVKYQALVELKQYSTAKSLLEDLIKNGNLFITEKKKYYKELALFYEKTNDYKSAFLSSQKYIKVSDSLAEVQSKNKVLELETKFNKIENEKRIKELESQKQKAILISKNNQLIYLLFGLLSLILLLIVFFLSKNAKTQKLLNKEVEKNYNQNISTLKTQKEMEVMQAMIDGEEIERKRIARELHDGIGSKLSALKILMLRIDSQQISNENLTRFNELLSTSITELRQVSYNLVPESLLKLGLENALGDLCHLLHSEKVKIEFQAFDISNTIPVSSQINIYRIVQELLNNALKHSGCSEILVSCSQNGNTFFISVEDNGKGFDISSSDDKTGLGIKNLKSRVELLNGTYNVESNKSGTYYNIELKI